MKKVQTGSVMVRGVLTVTFNGVQNLFKNMSAGRVSCNISNFHFASLDCDRDSR